MQVWQLDLAQSFPFLNVLFLFRIPDQDDVPLSLKSMKSWPFSLEASRFVDVQDALLGEFPSNGGRRSKHSRRRNGTEI